MAATVFLHYYRVLQLQVLLFAALASAGHVNVMPPLDNTGFKDNSVINVHIVPHSHDDVGWVKTVDQYYSGTNSSIEEASVQFILDTVVEELWRDDSRRFIYVEMFYFERWWREQDESTRGRVRTLVKEGRLEFANGGWSMNDEGCTHYTDIIDQVRTKCRLLLHQLVFRFIQSFWNVPC